jgi:hypothetical protein
MNNAPIQIYNTVDVIDQDDGFSFSSWTMVREGLIPIHVIHSGYHSRRYWAEFHGDLHAKSIQVLLQKLGHTVSIVAS